MSRRTPRVRAPLSRFCGRTELLARIEALLKNRARLLTLVGPPGIGKTRTALELASRRTGAARFVDLSTAISVADLSSALLAELQRPEASGDDLAAALAGEAGVLFILDNFEQLPPEAALEVERWCRLAPELQVLVTSRLRLGVEGEQVVEVGPLGLPPAPTAPLEELLAAEAVQLFVERAAAATTGGVQTAADNEAAVREIAVLVQELDGWPLAIELAAARSRMLSPRELRERLRDRFLILSRPARSAGDRHARLEAAIDSSWVALSPDEQRALAECSVFSGSFSLEAAERVLDGGDVLGRLEALRDRSLLQAEFDPLGRTMRFALLESIRQYAAERLAERSDGAAHGALERHRAHYLSQAAPRAEAVARTGDAAARAWLESERQNLIAIARDLEERHLDGPYVDAVLALEPVMLERPAAARLELVDRAIERTAGDDGRLARLYLARGKIAGLHGRAMEAIRDLQLAVERAQVGGARSVEAEALVHLGVRYRQRADFVTARTIGEEARALAAGSGYPRIEAIATAVLGLLHGELGDTERARHLDLQALEIFRRLGDRASVGLALGNLAQLAQASAEPGRADPLYREAIAAFVAAQDRLFEGTYRGLRAGLLHERGELAAAELEYEEALRGLEWMDVRHVQGLLLAASAALLADQDRVDEAERRFGEAAQRFGVLEVPGYRAAVELLHGLLELARARQALRRGQAPEEAREFAARAAARVAVPPGEVVSSQAVRFALRLLERALARHAALVGPEPSDAADRPEVLRVASDGTWFELGRAARVDLRRRAALRRLLAGLLERRRTAPGVAVDPGRLFEVGWPGDRAQPDAASTRLRVAVATLRRLGLAAAIVTSSEGYALSPELPLRIVQGVGQSMTSL
jgi:predicted ATPase